MRYLLIIFLSSITCVWANIDVSGLDRSQREKLFAQQMVMLEQKIGSASWPRLKIYQLVSVDTEEFAAFFADFEYQKTYIPNLLKSSILLNQAPNKIDVSYELDLPWPIPNAKYIHSHKVEKIKDDHFKVSWSKLESSVASELYGYAEFVRFNDKTLWYYENFTSPKSSLAGLFEASMKVDTSKSLEATIEAFKSLKQSNPAKLQDSINLWRKNLLDSTK